MANNKEQKAPNNSFKYGSGAAVFLTSSLAAYTMLRKGNYKAALFFYRHSGGGLNIYKQHPNGKSQRFFAIDYHPILDSKTKEVTWKLHYHRGENPSQMKKHRPYEGGW